MGFSRQEWWSGLSFPLPGDLLHPGMGPRFPALQADSLLSKPPGKPLNVQAEGQLDEQLASLWCPQWHTLYLICFAFTIKSTSLIKAVDAHCEQPKSYTRLIINGNNPPPIPSHCWAIIFRANHFFGCLSWLWSITWCWEMLVAMAFS